jgi:hypothetical protein
MKKDSNNPSDLLLEFTQIEPWPEPVDGSALLDALAQVIKRFVVLPQWAAETLALWTVHTYAFHLRDISTYIGVESPEKRCGKTTLLGVLSELVSRPIVAANISSPAFFRVIEETQPTLLIDEADTFLRGNDELRGILNSGYTRKTAYVVRVATLNGIDKPDDASSPFSSLPRSSRRKVAPSSSNSSTFSNRADSLTPSDEERAGVRGSDSSGSLSLGERARVRGKEPFADPTCSNSQSANSHESSSSRGEQAPSEKSKFEIQKSKFENSPVRVGSRLVRFSCWCPKVMAAIGRLPDTLADRCIVIRMQRKTQQEQCERLRNVDTRSLQQQCARFVLDHVAQIASASPVIPPTLHDRAADIWEPLFVLADLAGGSWPDLARQAAISFTGGTPENNSIGSLMIDMIAIFTEAETDRMFSRDIVERLNDLSGRPWADSLNGRPATELWLSQRLRPYGVRPKTMWIGDTAAKGYDHETFIGIFRRYITRADLELLRSEVPPAKDDSKPVDPSGASVLPSTASRS